MATVMAITCNAEYDPQLHLHLEMHPWHINRFARRAKSDFALISVAQLYAGRNRMQL